MKSLAVPRVAGEYYSLNSGRSSFVLLEPGNQYLLNVFLNIVEAQGDSRGTGFLL